MGLFSWVKTIFSYVWHISNWFEIRATVYQFFFHYLYQPALVKLRPAVLTDGGIMWLRTRCTEDNLPAFARVNEVHSTCQRKYVQTVCTRNFINHWMLLLGVGILQCLSWFLRTATLWPLHVRAPQDSFSSTGSPESLLVCFRLWGSVPLWKGQGCLFTASLESPGNYRLHEKLFTWGILSSWMIMT